MKLINYGYAQTIYSTFKHRPNINQAEWLYYAFEDLVVVNLRRTRSLHCMVLEI